MAIRVLVIEDSRPLAANICDFLASRGFVTDYAADGLTGLHLATTETFDVIVLDLGLPGLDGLAVGRLMREQDKGSTKILMLTARDTLEDKLEGFEAGADDYLVKPFELRELAARLTALARRDVHSRKLTVGPLSLDLDRLEVTRQGRSAELTPATARLLEEFMRRPGRILGRRHLEMALWGDDPPESDALRTHIYLLRNAIDKPFDTDLLITVRGAGWRLDDGEEEDGGEEDRGEEDGSSS